MPLPPANEVLDEGDQLSWYDRCARPPIVECLGIDDMVLTYRSEHWIDPWHEDGVQYWDVGMHFKEDVGPGTSFGSIRICVADQHRVDNLVESFDNLSADLYRIGKTLYEPETGDLRDDLFDLLSLPGKTIIVDRVTIDHRLRGHGLGVYLSGLALDYLSHGAGVIALFPGPVERDSQTGYEQACANLGRAWSRIGFEPYNDGTWILDPGLTTLNDTLHRERERLQHHRWNVTFCAEERGPWPHSAISAITMPKSAPHPMPSPPVSRKPSAIRQDAISTASGDKA
ncbi:hypothetical protein ACFVRD_37215 [Streptomyces sp. NPDC057908]|uniref:hypothetical protein n=1 Tax=Streptomyces sp. NPDC057908 TaxID=3346276 RepID=UPI0036E1181F